MKKPLLFLLIYSFFGLTYSQSVDNIPSLGDASSGSISLSGEYELGRLWLSLFRSSVNEYDDPITKSYIKDFIYRLSETSEVRDRRYEFVVIEDPSINAFAAPGGIIGINKGMFLKTDSEGEFASVMAHELAHLSQRHYARSQNQSSPLANALILIGSVAAAIASSNPQALYIGPALIQQLSINFTRSNEKEADRIGFRNLVNAGFDPSSQSKMFQKLQKNYRGFNDEAYSYLMSHPLPKERITDARIRERGISKNKFYRNSLEFYLIKSRAEVSESKDLESLKNQYRQNLTRSKDKNIVISSLYGLSLVLKNQKKFIESFKIARDLVDENPFNLVLQTNILEIHLASENSFEAVSLGENLLRINNGNYAISYYLAKAYLLNDDPIKAEKTLLKMSEDNTEDPSIWYFLAEAQGLSGNILGLHRSRAEYFILTGRYDAAVYQLREALKLSQNFFEIRESIINKLEDIFETKRALKNSS
jgi:predicted Zn-dependent protease